MSGSGLIYAVIVGAWAAYLVPMWLRRQDELNEARPTERFSTAIRLLSGRAAMERRISRALDGRAPRAEGGPAAEPDGTGGQDAAGTSGASGGADAARPDDRGASGGGTASDQPGGTGADVPGGAGERDTRRHPGGEAPAPAGVGDPSAETSLHSRQAAHPHPAGGSSTGRAALLARRRRMVTLLFAAFTLGMTAAAVGGVDWLWAPGVPAVLFTLYIAHLRRQERRRYEVRLDRRRAAEAAQRLRERERERAAAARPAAAEPAGEADSRRHAIVEATDHDEWVDGLRTAGADPEETWDPVPLPLPTYVTAPVAPRSTPALDLNAPDAWSAARSVVPPEPQPQPRPRTPLFDQYAEDPAPEPRPRAANE